MTNFIRAFIQDERGQDFMECSLLIGLVAIVAIAVLVGSGNGLKGIWDVGHTQLAAGNTVLE